MPIRESSLPATMKRLIQEKATESELSGEVAEFSSPLISDDEQGVAPDWYPNDPDVSCSLCHVGESLVLNDYRDGDETDDQILSRLLDSESDEEWLELFELEEHPGIILMFLLELQGQAGVWISGVGISQNVAQLEKYLLKEHHMAIAGGKSSLSLDEILMHNRKMKI